MADEIELNTDIKNKNDRSISITPRVWFDASTAELSTSCLGLSDVYELSLQDASGAIIAQFVCAANGSVQRYNIPNMQRGQYRIWITTAKGTFVGTFKF